jgi:hypothetical protein
MRSALVLSLALACLASGAAAPAPDIQDGWRVFEGSWSASGRRQSLPTETPRSAFTVYLSGSVVITGEGVSKGFRGEAIAFDDGAKVSTGRCVWTDQHGDRIFSVLAGEAIGAGRRLTGTITGGTGRYAGVTGDYSFEWQYVVADAESGGIQGRAVGLKGRYRTGEAGR